MIIPTIVTAIGLTLLLVIILARLAVKYVILDNTWIQLHRDTEHVRGSRADKKIVHFALMANSNPSDWLVWISARLNRCLMRVTPDDRAVIRGLRHDPKNSARIDAHKILVGETVSRFVPIELACPINLTTPGTEDGVDGLYRNISASRRTFYTIPDFHRHMDIPMFTSLGVRYFVRMRVDCRRCGNWIHITKHSVEIIEGQGDELKCMRLSYGSGLGLLYCWAYSKKGSFCVSVSPAAYSASVLDLKHITLGAMRTGHVVSGSGDVKVLPNAGFIKHSFTLDKIKVTSQQVTVLAALLETATKVIHFEILDDQDVIVNIDQEETDEEPEPDRPENGLSQHPMTPTNGPETEVINPLSTAYQDEVATPLMALCQGGRGSELSTGTDFDITRVMLSEESLQVPKVVGRMMIPSAIDGSLTVPLRNKKEAENTVHHRIDIHNVGAPVFTKEQWVAEKRLMQDFINEVIGPECKNTAELPDSWQVLKDSKPAVKNEVNRNRRSLVEVSKTAFLKSEPIKVNKAARVIVAANEEMRVEENMWRLGAVQALEQSAVFQNYYGFGDPKHIEKVMSRVQDFAMTNNLNVAETDFAAMDGTVNEITRTLELMIMKHLFSRKNHNELEKVMGSLVNLDPKPLKGVKLKMGFQRKSGEAFTSLFNTLINLYVMWVPLKNKFKKSKDRLLRLGIAGGDDGMMAMSIDQKDWEESAERLGMKLKFQIKGSTETACFLAIFRCPVRRICFPDVERFVAKFGINSSGLDSTKQLFLKAEAIVDLWDRIPLVSETAIKVLSILGTPKFTKGEKEHYEDRKGYLLKMLGKGSKFTSVTSDKDYAFVLHEYSKSLDVKPVVVAEAISRINAANTFSDFPSSWIPMHPFPEVSTLDSPYLFGSFLVPAADSEVNHPSITTFNDRGNKNISDAKKE